MIIILYNNDIIIETWPLIALLWLKAVNNLINRYNIVVKLYQNMFYFN